MTPCAARDGDTATADKFTGSVVCVGCGQSPADLLRDLVREVTAPRATGERVLGEEETGG
jgi:lysine/ornithine N-monooxygenase